MTPLSQSNNLPRARLPKIQNKTGTIFSKLFRSRSAIKFGQPLSISKYVNKFKFALNIEKVTTAIGQSTGH